MRKSVAERERESSNEMIPSPPRLYVRASDALTIVRFQAKEYPEKLRRTHRIRHAGLRRTNERQLASTAINISVS